MRSRMWIVVIGLAVVTTSCTRSSSSSVADQSAVVVGEKAPAFSLPSANGGTVSLSDYAGKPVLLYFSMGPG